MRLCPYDIIVYYLKKDYILEPNEKKPRLNPEDSSLWRNGVENHGKSYWLELIKIQDSVPESPRLHKKAIP